MNVIENNTLAEVSGGLSEQPISFPTHAADPDPAPIICRWPPTFDYWDVNDMTNLLRVV